MLRCSGAGVGLMLLAGCVVGPDYVAPRPAAPDDWTSWRSADPSLVAAPAAGEGLSPDWWKTFKDPVLDSLIARALAASPDMQTAALHFAQARVQRMGAAAAGLPQISANVDVNRQRQSEYGASTRLFDAIGSDRNALAKLLSQPFTLYRGGFDASWEPDLWGKVRRSLEAADAGIAQQGALLDLTRLTVAAEVAQTYFELRTTQRQIALSREDIALLQDRVSLVTARVEGGLDDHTDLATEEAALHALEAQLPFLLTREAAQANAIALLLGERPGSLAQTLKPGGPAISALPPDLALGLPSEVALHRPDVRAAEARLHAATARIGVAVADLYPSIRLGGGFKLESYRSETLFDWASRTWSIVPSLDLPLFDGGRRRSVVKLRKLEQREAAVDFQQTVLRSWQEIDDALSQFTSERQQRAKLLARVDDARGVFDLAGARYRSGAVNYLAVIDAERALLQARRDLAENEGRLRASYVAVNKAMGNTPPEADANAAAMP
ncbi:MAG TPA: efflux transporter outer membrane subunit [Novosphingobium sp.]|nr:efflux transporter outer membrane subunit [Novosphingobium sp.]